MDSGGVADIIGDGEQHTEGESARKKLKVEQVSREKDKTPAGNGKGKCSASSLLPVEEKNLFANFTFKRVLRADPSRKMAFLHGQFEKTANEDEEDSADGASKDAVVILEQSAFHLDHVEKMLAAGAKGDLEFQNDVYHNYRVFFPAEFNATKTTIIYPATQSHIEKFGQQPVYIVDESPDDYLNITLPSLQKSKRFDTKWVDNILDHEKETERIVFEDPDKESGFVLLPDLKWDGHNVDSLYLIALPHKRGIHSIRDLTSDHLTMLNKIKNEGTAAITEKYGLPASRIRAFFHYQPTFYHLHIHFTNIHFDAPGRNAEKAHMLTTVISNLQYDDYYKKATIPFVVGEKDPLFALYDHCLKPPANGSTL
ncbi:m7GpppX diphosphatase [Hypsibius exemplaris]|uniref:m7GpppX diphosphatase n=1 Tax=Hypsibius exemplaris TaxID=2072580 RepID=A0A9X6NAF6_HYPEX|nr:m7GpppX diphosphatase [Hypsibius exemplaris]